MAIPIPAMIAATRAVMAAKKAGSLVNQGKKFNKLQKANLGIGVPAAGAGAAGMLDDSEMQIMNILQEQGKTISDMDRNLIKQMLASGTPPEVVIKTMLGESGKTMPNMGRQMMAGGGTPFPDLTGDGKVTQADILKGRGVYATGGEAIGDELEGMEMSEEQAMAEVGNAEKEMQMIQQLVAVVQKLIAEGISEKDLIAFLKEQGLDDEDIDGLMQMVLQSQGSQDPEGIDQQIAGMM